MPNSQNNAYHTLNPEAHHIDKAIAVRLREIRVAQELKQSDTAKALGFSMQLMSKYENARNRISCVTLHDLLKYYKVDMCEFWRSIP